MEPTENEIIERCLEGDRDVYALLVERYQQMVYTLAYRMLGDEAAAKDAAQESFLSAYVSLRRFKGGAKFSTWLMSIALNKCRDALRARRETVSVAEMEEMLPDPAAGPETRLQRKEEQDRLQKALNRLPDEYREVIVMKHVQGRDYAEIAAAAGASEGALKVRAWRAREMLRSLLVKEEDANV